MTAMKEKLEAAGIDTLGARLTAACVEAIHACPVSDSDAWHHVGRNFGHEIIRQLRTDMRGPQVLEPRKMLVSEIRPPHPSQTPSSIIPIDPPSPSVAPYKPRIIAPERLEKRRELQHIMRSKYKNSGGIAWSDVGWHELALLKRDGNEAEALLAATTTDIPNDGRTVGDVLGIKRTDEIIAQVRSLK